MIAIIFLTLAILALPVMGEIWKHPENNIVTQMRVEVREIVGPYTTAAAEAYTDLREEFKWSTILVLIVAIIKALVDLASDLIEEIRRDK